MVQLIGYLAWIVIGALAGWLAGMAMKSRGGYRIDMGVGVVGALVSGFLFSLFGFEATTGFTLWSFLIAFLGAAVLVTAICLTNERRRQRNGESRLR